MADDFSIDFPTLLVAHDWAEQHCIVPDGFRRGEPFLNVDWQTWCLLNAYRVRPDAKHGQLATAFHWRRSQIVLPQKAGKAPQTAERICVEAVGPALFAGWAVGGESWDCREHGCGCGWVYEYLPGEAMGMPWPTPLIQIVATSEDQTDNIYSALRPMIELGPLAELIPKTGEEFIRLPNGGRIDPVTANATSRLGQRVTFAALDESGLYTKTNGMIHVAETIRRGLAGMGGRAEETTNAWDPTEDSVAQRTERAARAVGDIFRHHPMAPSGLSYANKAERRKIHQHVYDGCHWIDLDGIDGEASELLEEDPAQAERFFGNRLVAGGGPAFDLAKWELEAAKGGCKLVGHKVPVEAVITIGVDGALRDDALAVVACEVSSGFVWPLAVIERPDGLKGIEAEEYRHDQARAESAIREAFERFTVFRLYGDTQYIEAMLDRIANDHGEQRVVKWDTYRPLAIGYAARLFTDSLRAGEVKHGDVEVLNRHIGNARKMSLKRKDDKERPLYTVAKESRMSPRKMDAAMAAVLAWKARSDAIKLGAVVLNSGEEPVQPDPEPKPQRWVPGTTTGVGDLMLAGSGTAPGDIS